MPNGSTGTGGGAGGEPLARLFRGGVVFGTWFLSLLSYGLQALGARLPLSQIIEAARAVMLEGAGWQAVAGTLGQVMVFALVCVTLGAVLFKWSAK